MQLLATGQFGEGNLTAGETDLWRVQLSSTSSIRTEVFGPFGFTLCVPFGDQPQLQLLNSSGTQLASGSAMGSDCPILDGRGTQHPRNPGAHDLPVGNYYLRVKGTTTTEAWPYRLAVVVG